jgi:PAS domain S-box-containing protein
MPDRGDAMKLTAGNGLAPREAEPKYDPDLLRASMASQRAALMTAPTPYVLISMQGEVVLLNNMFTEVTGYTIADLPDISACLLKMRRVPKDEVETMLDGWLRQQSKASVKEVTIVTAWNEVRIWQIRTTDPVLWPDGRTVILQSMIDLTEQRRLEEALRRNQEEMRVRLAELEALYSSAPLGLAMLDKDLRFVRANEALATINGMPSADHIGRFVFDVVPHRQREAEPVMRRVLETGKPIRNLESHGEAGGKPGVQRDWLEHIYALSDAKGDAVGLGVIVEEITERKKVESELASTNAALRRTLDLLFLALRTAGVSVFTQDKDLRYLWVGGDYFGCDGEAAVGKNDAALLPTELVAPMLALKQRVFATGEAASGDMPYQRDGKTHWCNIHVEPWRSRQGMVRSLLGAVSDVTGRKATEQHIRTLLSELAHRSKNLLTVIQVMARRSVSPNVPSTVFVDSFIERLSGLAQSHDLLAREDWRGISMHELVTSQIGHLKTGSVERLLIEGPDMVLTPVAAQNLGMAIHELSTNAVKYGALSVAGGHVRISWSLFEDESGQNRMRLAWVERGGPHVVEPKRRGFGRFVIEAIAARALSGVVDLRFDPEGVSCIIEGVADDSVLANVGVNAAARGGPSAPPDIR